MTDIPEDSAQDPAKPKAARKGGSKKALNAANLKALGADRLAELVLELAGDYPAAKRLLRLELAGRVSAEDLAAEIGKRLEMIGQSQVRVSWRRYREFVRDLDMHRQAIAGRLAELDPNLALSLIVRFAGLERPVSQRVKDAKGEVEAAFAEAISDAAEIAGQAKLADQRDLERQLLDILTDGEPRGVELLAAVAPALDARTIANLRGQIDQAMSLRRRPNTVLTTAAQELAGMAGDVDAYIGYFTPSQAVLPPIGARIARSLLGAGRLAEARAALARSVPTVPGRPLSLTPIDGGEWDEVNIALLEAEGDPEGAQAARWANFEASLSPARLKGYLKRLGDFDDVVAEEKAIDLASRSPDPHAGLKFLIDWPALPAAAELVIKRQGELRADRTQLLERAAAALAGRYPLAATLLLRLLIWETVRYAISERYPAAEKQLAEAGALAAAWDDDAIESHEAFARRVAAMRRW